MNVLIASDFYEPFIGGAERQVQLLAGALASRAHNVRVATVWHHGSPERESEGKVEVHRLRSLILEQRALSSDPVRRFHPPFPVPGIVRGLRAMIAERQPSVVNANGWIAYSCAAALSGSRIPLVLSVRDYGYSCAVRTLMRFDRSICSGPAPAKCLRCANHRYGALKAIAAVGGVSLGRPLLTHHVVGIHVVSEYIRSIVLRDLIGEEETNWTPPVVRIPDIPPHLSVSEGDLGNSSQISMLPSEPFILFVGQLTKHKGLYTLLEAYRDLENPPPLVLIGTVWPDTPTSLPPGVVMVGEAPHALVLEAWRRSLFGVAPSIWPDPLPGVVREAMSQGKPVIGSAVGGILDMIDDGQTGLLVAPGDANSLRSAMASLLANPDLRERLGRAAQQATAQITAESVASEFERFYASVQAGP
jgi:glycosyltransferase involved in cell wall biosynthesis